MKKVFSLLFIACLLVFIGCQSTKTATVSKLLKFNFEKGRGYDYELILNMDQVENKETRQTDMTAYYSMYVTADSGNVKTIKTKYERFKINLELAGLNMEIDTEKPMPVAAGDKMEDAFKMMNKFFGAIKGKDFTIKVNGEGKILEITGFEAIANSVADSMGLTGERRENMLMVFGKQFNEKSVKDQLERFLFIFPDKEVKVGDSWEKSNITGGMMGGTYSSVYTVTDIEGDMVTLEESTKIGSDKDPGKMNGKISGTLTIDSKTGLVVKADQDITGTINDTKINGKTRVKGKAN
jgi:hypothetical protein